MEPSCAAAARPGPPEHSLTRPHSGPRLPRHCPAGKPVHFPARRPGTARCCPSGKERHQWTPSCKITERPVRRLDAADLGACIDLSRGPRLVGGGEQWRLMFAVSEVYGVDDPAGGLAGIAALTRYGADLAVIGMMLVASRHGRQGLGQRLMRHVLRLAGGAVVYLTATAMGRPLYEQLGFRPVDTSTRYSGVFSPRAGRCRTPGVGSPAGQRRPGRRSRDSTGRSSARTAAACSLSW